jgi:hypothetical protein
MCLKGTSFNIAKSFRRVLFRIRKHFYSYTYSVYGKMVFFDRQVPRAYATDVRLRTPNFRDCEENSSTSTWQLLVNFSFLSLCLELFTDGAGFKRNGVFNIHNTHIQEHKSGTMQFCRVRDNLHRRAQPCIRNHSRHFEQFLGFLFCFSFHLVFTLSYLTRFCGSVYLKSFSAISFIVRFCHSLFLKRFYGYSYLDLLEDSEPSRSGWNLLNWTLNLKCLTTF